jgi:hypothetical protein
MAWATPQRSNVLRGRLLQGVVQETSDTSAEIRHDVSSS